MIPAGKRRAVSRALQAEPFCFALRQGKRISYPRVRSAKDFFGATVAISYTANAQKAAEVVAAIEAAGGAARAFQADQADEAQVVKLIAAVASEFGTLDILVNIFRCGGLALKPTQRVCHVQRFFQCSGRDLI